MIDANVGIDYAKYDEGGYANAEGTGILTLPARKFWLQ